MLKFRSISCLVSWLVTGLLCSLKEHTEKRWGRWGSRIRLVFFCMEKTVGIFFLMSFILGVSTIWNNYVSGVESMPEEASWSSQTPESGCQLQFTSYRRSLSKSYSLQISSFNFWEYRRMCSPPLRSSESLEEEHTTLLQTARERDSSKSQYPGEQPGEL